MESRSSKGCLHDGVYCHPSAVLFLCLVVWQLVVAGKAVMDTQAALRDAVKVASTSGDVKKAEDQAKKSFGAPKEYKLQKIRSR